MFGYFVIGSPLWSNKHSIEGNEMDVSVIKDVLEAVHRDERTTLRDLIVTAECIRVPWSALVKPSLSTVE